MYPIIDKFRRHSHRHFRGRHRHGFFAAGFGAGGGLGGRGFRTGRKLGSEDLQRVILALLEERPRHGYEVIKELEERSSGFYTPSPGMVYPALTYLEEIGHATVAAEGAKKLYSITDSGRAALDGSREMVESLLEQLAQIGRKMERVRQVFTGEEGADEASSSRSSAVRMARRELREALLEKRHAAPAEQQRVAGILQRATEEIRGK